MQFSCTCKRGKMADDTTTEERDRAMTEEEDNDDRKAWLRRHLESILQKKEKWVKVDDFDVSPGCPPGENFVADIFRIVVYGKRLCLGVWTDFRKNFIIKRIPDRNSFSHKFHDCHRLFENEIVAYETILPAYQNYLKKSMLEVNELSFPRYYGRCRMYLVVQDLQVEGYQVVNRVKGFSKRECSVILQELSRFHAVSFAMKKREKVAFSKMAAQLTETVFREDYADNLMGVVWENSLTFALRSLNESNCPKLQEISEKLTKFSGRVLTTLSDLSKPTCDKFSVICHGDLWNNNILLRFCDSGYPIGVKFIDLQAMRFGPCVLDVLHVLFTSSRPVVCEKHLGVLLGEYYDALVGHLRALGEGPDFTFDEFESELGRRIFFGVLLACLMFTVVTRTSAPESPDPGAFTKENLSRLSEVDRMYLSLDEGYHERLRALFRTLANLNLI